MDRIRLCADHSIRRGCGFGILAITTAMFAMASEPLLALRGGALMMTVMWAILLLKGLRAPTRDYRQTELWLLLDRKVDAVPKSRIQDVLGRTLRERYFWHADVSASITAAMWLLSFALAAFH